MKTAKVKIRGAAPLLMHSAALVDPTNPATRAIHNLTAKKTKKTDADIDEIARLEFIGGLYVNADGVPCIPMENLEAVVRAGATAQRKGKDTQCAVYCTSVEGDTDSTPLVYDGPSDPDELYKLPQHVHRCSVCIGKVRVMRVRPKFPTWELDFLLHIDEEMMSPRDVERALVFAGHMKGLGDYRPKYGRFEVVDFKLAK